MKKLLALVLLTQTFSFGAYSQVPIRDSADFYYDDFGWSIGISAGLVLPDTDFFELSPLPAITLATEYKPYKGLSFDTNLGYFQHDIGVSEGDLGVSIGNKKTLVIFVGGNYYFDNSSVVTPYITTDFGLSLNNASSDVLDESDWWIAPATQAGVGLEFDLGAVALGPAYNYIFVGGYPDDMLLDTDYLRVAGFEGHKIDLKIKLTP